MKRKCSIDNETLNAILDSCKGTLNARDTLYIGQVVCLLEKALEYVETKKDLSNIEILDIKRIRDMIKGL